MAELTRVCKKCGLLKSHSDFVKRKRCLFGIGHTCNKCTTNTEKFRQYQKEYRKKNSKKIYQKIREYVINNRDKYRSYYRKYYSENKEKVFEKNKRYRHLNRERINKYNNTLRSKKIEIIRAQKKESYKRRKNAAYAYQKKWKLKNHDKSLLYSKTSRKRAYNELRDSYIKQLLCWSKNKNGYIPRKEIPNNLVDLKRILIINKRELKKIKNESRRTA